MMKALTVSAMFVALGWSATASASELLLNGGFEGGVYAAASTDSQTTNPAVPVDWSANNGFLDYPSYDEVSTADVRSGNYALQIGNYDYQPVPTLSQAFHDVVGAAYTVSFYGLDSGAGKDPNAFLNVSAGGQSATLHDDVSGDTYTPASFRFIGTGSDTLQISAETNANEWHVDDVAVNGPAVAVSAVPEPSTWALMILGIGGIGLAFRQAKRNHGFRFKDGFAV